MDAQSEAKTEKTHEKLTNHSERLTLRGRLKPSRTRGDLKEIVILHVQGFVLQLLMFSYRKKKQIMEIFTVKACKWSRYLQNIKNSNTLYQGSCNKC